MRIKIINPNTHLEGTQRIERVAKANARPGTEVIAVSPEKGPDAIEGSYDEALAVPGVLEEIKKGIEDGYEGFIIACFLDTGLYAARDLTDKPVIGIGEASMHMACMLGRRFAMLLPAPRWDITYVLVEFVRRYGLEDRFASARGIGLGVLDIDKDIDKTLEILKEEGTKAILEDGGEVILLGCAGFAELDKRLEKELGVPVIDPVIAALKFMEAILDYGKKTSKISFRLPARLQS